MDEHRGVPVYEAPDAAAVHDLLDELVVALTGLDEGSTFVRAAMAHLNLVMIHPFRGGNGRMARCLQTLILARDSVLSPEFSSVDEYLGANTLDYYAALAAVGAGSWNPGNDAGPWVRFRLRAHHVQAQRVLGRLAEVSHIWATLDDLVAHKGLPERAVPALYDATIGLRVRRAGYRRLAAVEDRTATRDLQLLVDAGLLVADGERRARTYRGGAELSRIRHAAAAVRPPVSLPCGEIGSLLGQQSPQQPRLPLGDWALASTRSPRRSVVGCAGRSEDRDKPAHGGS